MVNLRAEGEPLVLRRAVWDGLNTQSVRLVWLEEAAFKPGRPVPVHRMDAEGKRITPKKAAAGTKMSRVTRPHAVETKPKKRAKV